MRVLLFKVIAIDNLDRRRGVRARNTLIPADLSEKQYEGLYFASGNLAITQTVEVVEAQSPLQI
jgi:hypothetical protein